MMHVPNRMQIMRFLYSMTLMINFLVFFLSMLFFFLSLFLSFFLSFFLSSFSFLFYEVSYALSIAIASNINEQLCMTIHILYDYIFFLCTTCTQEIICSNNKQFIVFLAALAANCFNGC